MPYVYHITTAEVATNFATSGTANTEVDQLFIKPGASKTVSLIAMQVGGKGAGLTAISGIAYRLKKYTTTSAAGGTGITPRPRDEAASGIAAVATCGAASAGVTVGTGGPTYVGGCYSGAAGPGGWVAYNADDAPSIPGGANKSIDLFSASGTISLNFEAQLQIQE